MKKLHSIIRRQSVTEYGGRDFHNCSVFGKLCEVVLFSQV